MNTDHLIETLHEENALRRRAEGGERRAESGTRATILRKVGRIALPAAAVAAVLLIVFLPRGNEAQASTPVPGVYCNSQCTPEDVLALIDNNINHIKQIQQS